MLHVRYYRLAVGVTESAIPRGIVNSMSTRLEVALCNRMIIYESC